MGDPVAFSAREARLFLFAFDVCRCVIEKRCINALERIDVDHGVEVVVNLASDKRDDTARGANMKLRRFGAKGVLGYERWIFHPDFQCAARIGSPDTTVLGTE